MLVGRQNASINVSRSAISSDLGNGSNKSARFES